MGIQLADKRHWKSVEVSPNVVVDVAHDGEIIGIEILKAHTSFKGATSLIVSKVASKPRRVRSLTA